MTQLLIDVGNSRLKWALAENLRLIKHGSHTHHGDPVATFTEVAAQLHRAPEAVWFANVTGDLVSDQLRRVMLALWNLDAHKAEVVDGQGGLKLAYAEPKRLGIDRWLMMQALWKQQQQAFIVVSAGTALTFDAVDAKGQHLGGVIAPGLTTMQIAVLSATRIEALPSDQKFTKGLGADTESCVRQGALHACAGLIDRLAACYPQACVRTVITGGDAEVLAPHLASEWLHRPDLVLKGLLALAPESP